MSLSAIRTIATSGLAASQVQIQIASSNIANADTDGYTRKTGTQSAIVTTAKGTGTAVTAIAATVDKYLLRDLVAATSDQNAADVASSFANSLQSLFGEVSASDDDGTSLADSVADLATALSELCGTPESDILANSALDSLTALTAQLRQTSDQVQGLRADADQQIAEAVEAANDALAAIDALNDEIVADKARGLSTADLEDQRNAALQTLAANVDVSYFVSANGAMHVATASGTVLVDSQVHALSYAPAAMVTAETVFGAISVDGIDLTSSLTGGRVGALIAERDDVLPEVEDELDALATTLIASLNSAYNAGTSLPAPDSLAGGATVLAADTLSASGTTRIALVDDDGLLVSYADFDLSLYTSVGDLVSAIDGTAGLDASVAGGVLTITATSGLGIAIADIDAELGDAAVGFSSYFGLNDLLGGSGAADIAVTEAVKAGGLSTLALGTATTLTVGSEVVSHSAVLAAALSDVLDADQAFPAAGALGATTTDIATYAAEIVADVATRLTSAESRLATAEASRDALSDAYASETGVNIDEETAHLTQYQQLYAASAQVLEILNQMFDTLLDVAQSA